MSEDISHIVGNASDKIKHFLVDRRKLFTATGLAPDLEATFGDPVVAALKLSEISIYQNAMESSSLEAKVTCKTRITQDMVNGGGNIHGGCCAFLIDVCSSGSIMALKISQGVASFDVSQSLNVVYHAPATIGENLRIVNTTMTVGRRVASARTEIWSETHHRLVASGVHIKMEPSPTKL
ncbi:hypothetical protein F5876DRAFT_31879 [Lentinula aff. lateritia]|uniref:Uncharacterized protein n=1 Tax=Lentinula aff. lateritia TaxID=2804960 RepID=A0ACC1UEC3_9AGAR|nr:hypothetical protein F5876DRAFT_31879 [Lentinula aff. lateritia]